LHEDRNDRRDSKNEYFHRVTIDGAKACNMIILLDRLPEVSVHETNIVCTVGIGSPEQ